MWASVVSLPLDGLPTLPFETLDPHSEKYVTLSSLEDVDVLFNSWPANPEARFAYAQLMGIGHMLIDKGFQDLLRRKMYCERFKIPPFEGAYDDMPEWWMLALGVMDKAEAEATKFKGRK